MKLYTGVPARDSPIVRLLSVCLSVTRWHCVSMTHTTIMGSSL